MARPRSAQSVANQIGARLMPILLVAVVGYATWIEVVLIGVKYLLQPPAPSPSRIGPAVAIITLYFMLFFPMAFTYFRTLYVVTTQPGYVPLPHERHRRRRSRSKSRKGSHLENNEKLSSSSALGQSPSHTVGYLDRGAVYTGRTAPPPGLEDFWSQNVFECELDGLPRWCSTCESWKPDRSHHSSEAGRCIYRFDHFCPWLGGVIAEPSFKFFVQFCAYAALFCGFIIATCAYFIAERARSWGTYDVNWIIIMALATVFFLFTSGMTGNATHAILINMTMTDKISHQSRTHYLAVLIPPSQLSWIENNGTTESEWAAPYPIITYPLPDQLPSTLSSSRLRRFAILQAPPRNNPYKLSSALENYKCVMGNRMIDWILPFHKSPCNSHTQFNESFGRVMYQLGPVVDQMVKDAGLASRMQPPQRQPNISDNSRDPLPNDQPLTETNTDLTAPSSEPKSSQHYVPPNEPSKPLPVVEPPGSLTMSRLQGYDGSG